MAALTLSAKGPEVCLKFVVYNKHKIRNILNPKIYCMRCARKNERERAGRGAARVTCRQKLKDMAIPNDIFLSLTFSSKMVGISSNIALQRIYFSEALRLAALGETPGQLSYSKLY